MEKTLTNCCKGCEDRKPNCHSICDKYKDWVNLYHKVLSEERTERILGYSQWLNRRKRRG